MAKMPLLKKMVIGLKVMFDFERSFCALSKLALLED
jgi:hypothetical protein